MVITSLTRNQVARKGTRVRIPPSPLIYNGKPTLRLPILYETILLQASLIPAIITNTSNLSHSQNNIIQTLSAHKCHWQGQHKNND